MKKIFTLLILLIFCNFCTKAQTAMSLPGGSYVINMGVVPQTIANGLKPYGMVYDLLKNYKVPVYWVINPAKSKDGVDFTHEGVSYSGGTFIISSEYRTTDVNDAIEYWESEGVSGNTISSALDVEVYLVLHHPPVWTLDKENGDIAVDFFLNAGIPASAHGGPYSEGWKDPSELNACDDIFVLPHADPEWESHNNLFFWNRDHKGNIWSGCHAVSVLENIVDPSGTIQLNFLSTTGLVPYQSHGNGSLPFTYSNHSDAVMQFIGSVDGATDRGSERIYLPQLGGTWRPGTTISVYDPDHSDIPLLSNGEAAVIAYGRAYDDSSRGWVIYEGGHDIDRSGTIEERIAAQRAFFNYSYFSTSDKNAWFDIELNNVPGVIGSDQSVNISFTVPPGVSLDDYYVTWSSSCGGSFTNEDGQSVTFTPTNEYTNCIITVTLTDNCKREIFASEGFYISGPVLPVRTQISGKYNVSKKHAEISWVSYNERDVLYYELQKSENGTTFNTSKQLFSRTDRDTSQYLVFDTLSGVQMHYRLKIVTMDNFVRHSNVIRVNANINPEFTISPNPAKNHIRLRFFAESDEVLVWKLYDLNGRALLSEKTIVKSGANETEIILPELEKGLYILTAAGKNFLVNRKLLILP